MELTTNALENRSSSRCRRATRRLASAAWSWRPRTPATPAPKGLHGRLLSLCRRTELPGELAIATREVVPIVDEPLHVRRRSARIEGTQHEVDPREIVLTGLRVVRWLGMDGVEDGTTEQRTTRREALLLEFLVVEFRDELGLGDGLRGFGWRELVKVRSGPEPGLVSAGAPDVLADLFVLAGGPAYSSASMTRTPSLILVLSTSFNARISASNPGSLSAGAVLRSFLMALSFSNSSRLKLDSDRLPCPAGFADGSDEFLCPDSALSLIRRFSFSSRLPSHSIM